MVVFITILIVIVGALLALVILVQNPKGGGLAAGFGGVSQVGGVQKTSDFLEKSTWYLGIALFVLCLISARFSAPSSNVDADIQSVDEATTLPTEQVDPVDGGLDVPDPAK